MVADINIPGSMSFRLVTILYFFPVLINWLVFNAKYLLPSLAVWICLLKPKIFCISIIILYCSTEWNLSQYIIHKAKTREKTKPCTSFKDFKLLKHTIFMHAIFDCVCVFFFFLSQVCCFQIRICQKSNTKQFLFIIKAIINPRIVVHFISSQHQKK